MIRIGILPFLFILLPIAIYAHSSSAIKKTPYSFVVNPGPLVPPTKGAVWPEPQTNFITENFFWIKPITFEFKVLNNTCDILEEAITRYHTLINRQFHNLKQNYFKKSLLRDKARENGYLNSLKISLTKACEKLPHVDMDETYELMVGYNNQNEAVLTSSSIWGILRGMETFSQILYHEEEEGPILRVNATEIFDYPRFKHRGILVDTSRHFIPLFTIFENLKAMSYNKMNVFHWHIVDDQSFPYESKKFPNLSKQGAYHPTMVYTQKDVQAVINFARLLGIRVIPEFDTPGHTRSWGNSIPALLTECYEKSKPTGMLGPMNPTRETTYEFLKEFFEEVIEVFPDSYLHIGGDEVEKDCWSSNPEIQEFIKINNITEGINKLQEIFIQQLYDIVTNRSAKVIVWEEVFNDGAQLNDDTIIQVWKSNKKLGEVTRSGYTGIISACWYLDHLSTGGDWKKYYTCEPYEFVKAKDRENILGGEACMWAEVVDATNMLQRIWPRASATAEVLWSREYPMGYSKAQHRMEEHVCRMNKRGIPAQPANGPGFCI